MDENYFRVPTSIFTSGLTKYELVVLVYLLSCQNDKQMAFPGYKNIAKCCAISRGKARRVVNGLIEKGVLRKQAEPKSYRKSHSNLCAIFLKNDIALKTEDTII
jgi:predicted transcriptional regulator